MTVDNQIALYIELWDNVCVTENNLGSFGGPAGNKDQSLSPSPKNTSLEGQVWPISNAFEDPDVDPPTSQLPP